jgi:hypothetical protein
MVTQVKRKARLSVTVAPELKAFAEEIAKKTNTTPSGIVSQCLKELAHNHKEKLMIEYYQAMTKEEDKFAKESISVIQKIASSWRD